LIVTVGGAATGELKNLLDELEKTNPINGYTTASGLLDDLLLVVGAGIRDENPDGVALVTQLRDRLDAGDLDDAELLAALKSLFGGEGPAELVKLLLGSGMDNTLLQALLEVMAGGDVDLLNLLMKVDMTGVVTAEDLLDAMMDIHSDDDGEVGDTTDDVPDLLELLFGTDPNDGSSYPETFVYRYEVKDDAKLKSQTFFYLDRLGSETPQSIADYTLSYYRNGTIRDTSFNFYESTDPAAPDGADTLAHSIDGGEVFVDRNSRKTRSLTYRGDARSSCLDFDGDGFSDLEEEASGTDPYEAADYPGGIPDADHTDDDEDKRAESGNTVADGIKDDAVRRSETFYHFHDEPYFVMPGEEVADYTYTYTRDGSGVRETTVYHYEAPMVRAEDSVVTDRKKLTITYLDDVIAAGEYSTSGYILDGEDGLNDGALKKTATYYYFDDMTMAGDEISDYTYNYITGTERIRETVIYNYNKDDGSRDDLRADEVTRETECMSKSLTYLGDELTAPLGYPAKSITYYYAPPDSLRGDENADWTETYNLNSKIVDKTYYRYGDTMLRANDTAAYSDEPLRLSETWGWDNDAGANDILKSQSYHSGHKGEERVDYSYSYFHRLDTEEDVRIQRTDYTYYVDDRTDVVRTYNIKGITDEGQQRTDTVILSNTTTYNYDPVFKYKLLNTESVGFQHIGRNPGLITGVYTTVANYSDYQIQSDSRTEGTNYKNYGLPGEIITGGYVTTSDFDVFGIMTGNTTVGTSRNAGGISGAYETRTTIDEFGVVTGSITTGQSGKEYAAGVFALKQAEYTTTTTNNKYGAMLRQDTVGENYSYVDLDGNGTVDTGTEKVISGVYTTIANRENNAPGHIEIDGYGTIRLSETLGNTLRGDKIIGAYTTIAVFDENSIQTSSETVGESWNIKGKTTGAYTTTAAFNEYGTMAKQETIGESYSYVDLNGDGDIDEVGERVVSGVYTTIVDSARNDPGAGCRLS
ncbi:MAG: hypothetical protein JRC86_08200, partial [Deltaproteobacteria bacterium]|nr:hypothetical protein [Deltaproteobacteria bacterium]